jgi:hypothetical protein
MIDDTTSDAGISAMVDIAGASGQHLNPGQTAELDGLLAQGLIKKVAASDRSESAQYALDSQGPEAARRSRRRRERVLIDLVPTTHGAPQDVRIGVCVLANPPAFTHTSQISAWGFFWGASCLLSDPAIFNIV